MDMSREVKPEPLLAQSATQVRVKQWVVIFGVIVAVIAAVGTGSYFSPWFELARLQRALVEGDAATLVTRMDMSAIREKLVVRLATEALQKAQLSVGDERVSQVILAVEATVDVLMQPESLSKMMVEARGSGGPIRVEGGYLNMGLFVFAIENKTTRGALTLRMRRMGPFSWMLDDLIFLTPQQLGVAPK